MTTFSIERPVTLDRLEGVCRVAASQFADPAIAVPCVGLLKLVAVARAAQTYRDKVEYTGGDSTEHFALEQLALEAALAALSSK
jgi:hypothetical protein